MSAKGYFRPTLSALEGFVFELMDSLMRWRASLMLDGRVDDLVREFIFPFALFVGGRWRSFANADELVSCFAATMQSRQDRGIIHLETRVVAMDLPRQGRFRVWVDHTDYSAADVVADRYSSLNSCRDTARGVQTEMLHVYPLAGPQVVTPLINVLVKSCA